MNILIFFTFLLDIMKFMLYNQEAIQKNVPYIIGTD